MKVSFAKHFGSAEIDSTVTRVGVQEGLYRCTRCCRSSSNPIPQAVNSEHLDGRARTSLASQPLFELYHLNILKSDARVNAAFDDSP
jgi:hypothetical protein